MNSISTRNAPAVVRSLVDKGVATLEVGRELEERIVLIFDELLRDFLLDDFLAPVILEPRLCDNLGCGAGEEERVVLAGNVEVDLFSPTVRDFSGNRKEK